MSVDRARGALVGLACGDALGTTVEFAPRGTFDPLTDLVGGGPFGLEPGQWTDDTSMALCLAESLLECAAFDPVDQLNRYVRWYRDGHLSATGRCFDIGITTSRALGEFERSADPRSGPTDRMSAGNGSIMRLAPVVLAYFPDRVRARHFAAESSKTTHGAAEAVDACQILADILSSLLAGETMETAILSSAMPSSESPGLQSIVAAEYRAKPESAIRGSGYVVHSLEAALWCFWHANSFEEAVLRAANLGDDADTTAAVCGQLAGTHWGLTAIPEHWRKRLTLVDQIELFADRLFAAAF
jgi:ADP-ribosyl-[dinitrogen reductase] hydrolase